jgi:hypothetical protein
MVDVLPSDAYSALGKGAGEHQTMISSALQPSAALTCQGSCSVWLGLSASVAIVPATAASTLQVMEQLSRVNHTE